MVAEFINSDRMSAGGFLFHQDGVSTLPSLNASWNPGQNACSSRGLWKVNVRWIGEGSQNSKHPWNIHEFVSFFSLGISWGGLKSCQRLHTNWALREALFWNVDKERKGGGPSGLERGKSLFYFCIALPFFFFFLFFPAVAQAVL